MNRRAPIAMALTLALGLSACGGGDDDGGESTTTTGESTTTTEVTLEGSTTTEAPATSTTAEGGPVGALTGLPGEVDRPALAIKIDNHPSARPQWGINDADVVLEEVVEGNITRFIAIFHAADADPVGPVRSARTSDVNLLANLNEAYFANSGGNAGALSAVRNSANLVNVNVNAQPANYYRERTRPAPHNLLSSTEALREGAPESDGRPPQLFEYRAEGDDLPSGAVDAGEVTIDFGGSTVVYTWDDELDGWARTQNGTPHVDVDDVQVAPTNVVIMEIDYGVSPADPGSPEARPTGSGTAWVLTEGSVVEGTWSRPDGEDVAVLETADGEPMTLLPGTTWVAYPRPGSVTLG